MQLSPQAKQLERSHAIQKVKASLITRTTSSMTTTANQRAAQRASVLAAIGKKDTVISIASPSLSRAERYLNRSAEKEKKMIAEDIDEENSGDSPSSIENHDQIARPSVADPFICAAGHLCECKGDPHDDDCLVCLNCNRLAHERCIEPLLISPSNMPFAISVEDLDQVARSRFDIMSPDEKNKVNLCILCDKRLKVLKVRDMPTDNTPPIATGCPPCHPVTRIRKTKKFPRNLVRELQRLAAFQCQVYIFTCVEKIGKEDRFKRVCEQYYGDAAKGIKGVCEQIIDGDHAFGLLYETVQGDEGSERRLKTICSGGTLPIYIAGVDFTVETISKYSNGKEYAGKTIWDMGLEVHKSLKKAQSLVTRLSSIVTVDRTGLVTSIASGKTEKNFYDAITNGMYAMEMTPDRDATKVVDIDEITGGDDANGEAGSQIQNTGDIALDIGGVLDDDELSSNNPFGVTAPPGYVFYGKFTFICFGPLSDHFSATLALGAPLSQTAAERKENSRAMLRKKESERKDVVRSIGEERGISIQTKVSMGLLAQKEDDADREHRQMHFLALSKELDGAQKLLDAKILIAEKMLTPAGSSAWVKIAELSDKIESLLTELDMLRNKTDRATNPIVSRVLEQASAAMGIPTSTKEMSIPEDTTGDDEEEY